MRIYIEFLEGLAKLHKEGYLHNDIKPANIMSNVAFKSSDATVMHMYLIDHGLVTQIGETTVSGTPYYIHPVYLWHKNVPLIPQKDVYAACLTIFIIESYNSE